MKKIQIASRGNIQLWGITGVQKEVVLASARSIVTVEEVVDELRLRPGGVVLPAWVIDAVSVVPGGARPSRTRTATTTATTSSTSVGTRSPATATASLPGIDENVLQATVPA